MIAGKPAEEPEAPPVVTRLARGRPHVDLGALGLADRWADLAIATGSLDWNYGPGWQGTLLDAYGIAPDPARIAYYRLMWELTS
jgi:aminoglycoside phosphotransferase